MVPGRREPGCSRTAGRRLSRRCSERCPVSRRARRWKRTNRARRHRLPNRGTSPSRTAARVIAGAVSRFTGGAQYYDAQYWEGPAVTPDKHRPYALATHKTYPAQFVSWYQAIAYCRWASRKLGYDVRLPAEWEWVQAATGGNPDYLYPWGKDWDPKRLVFSGAGERGRSLRASGLYPNGESPVGALDMCGNVYEWCLNEFERITVTEVAGDRKRTTRGGAFFSPPEHCTVRHRLDDSPDARKDENQRIAVAIRLVAVDPPADVIFYRRLGSSS